MLNQNKIDISG